MNNKRYWFFGSKLNTILLLILIILMVVALKYMLKEKQTYLPYLGNQSQPTPQNQIKGETYMYTAYGFSIELPKGFVPRIEEAEGGPYTLITLPESNGTLIYNHDMEWWNKYDKPTYVFKGTEKIGENTFSIYQYTDHQLRSKPGHSIYLYQKGNVGYQFNVNDANKVLLKTFKFVGWSQVEGNKEDLVSFSIKPGQEVSGKMIVTGILKGGYFFEGNLPITILDANKKPTQYGPGHANATTEWGTIGPVSFSQEFDFSVMPKGQYYIKLTQDDPSGGESGRPIRFVIIPIIVK